MFKKELIDANRHCLFVSYGDGRVIILALKYGQEKLLIIGNFLFSARDALTKSHPLMPEYYLFLETSKEGGV